jgi:hypothetical protein
MPGDCGCPTRPRCWTVGRNEIADAVGDVAGSCPPLLFSCAGAAGDRNQCRCSLRGCRQSPPAAMAAVALVSASAVLGVGGGPHFFRRCPEAGGSFCAGPRRPSGPCAGGCPGCGLAVVVHQAAVSPRSPLILQHTGGAGAAARQRRQQPSAASPERKTTQETRADPPSLCCLSRVRLASCKIHLPRAQPHVHRAKLNTTAFLAGNPANFLHLARVGPLYDKTVYHSPSRWQPCLASGSYLLRDNFRVADQLSSIRIGHVSHKSWPPASRVKSEGPGCRDVRWPES